MSENQKTEKTSSAPLGLVLFVGFIFGVIVGFMAKDPVVKQLSMMKNTNLPPAETVVGTPTSPPSTGTSEATPAVEGAATEATPAGGDVKPVEEKKLEEEAKPAEVPAPVVPAAIE